MLNLFLENFVLIFVAIDPITILPIFATFTKGLNKKDLITLCLRSTLTAFGILLLFWLFEIFPNWFFYGVIIREILILLGSIYVLFNTNTLSVSKYGKFGTVLIFFSICFFVINYTNESVLFVYFGLTSLIFYYFVALEYFYRIIKDE